MARYLPVIGLEVHTQLATRSKMFCACSAAYGGKPNTQTCPVCLGLPGALPVVNARAVEAAVMMGLATNCSIASRSVFARKNYFYPDCPKNYQISQFDMPLCEHGSIVVGGGRRIGITRIHLEEDAGKLLHEEDGEHSLVDMNRVGVPLIEIVSEPDMRTTQEASSYMRKLRSLVRYLGISDGNLEEGSLRCDVNVSLRKSEDAPLGVKTEVKNLNSFKAVEHALDFEISRQTAMLDAGETVEQQTLLWDAEKNRAQLMRSKEESHDYRYFPEPDLRVLDVPESVIERLRKALPELPDDKAERFESQLGLPAYDAGVLTASKEVADYFEATAARLGDAKAASNWVMGEVLRELKERNIEIGDFSIAPNDLAALIAEQQEGRVNMPTAKEVFKDMLATGRDAKSIIRDKGLEQISDSSEIEAIVTAVLDEHPDEVASFLGGKEALIKFFVGQVMKQSRGKANPALATELLTAALEARR